MNPILKCCLSPLFSLLLISVALADVPNLALQKPVSGTLMKSDVSVITDGVFAVEGADWNVPKASVSEKDNKAQVIVELGSVLEVRYVVLQADWNDSYILEIASGPNAWQKVTYVPKMGYTPGLRTRAFELKAPIHTDRIRIRGGSGDGTISIAEFQLYAAEPSNWKDLSNREVEKPTQSWIPFLSVNRIDRIKAMLISVGVLCAFWLLIAPDRYTNIRRGLLCIFALLSFALWCNVFQYHYAHIIHRHEFFHYYLGSKYNRELSYSRLYECSTVADREDGFLTDDQERSIRNLLTNRMESSKGLLTTPDRCKRYFSPEQWASFKKDLSWFRQNMEKDEYNRIYGDHGFNATPVWSILGSLISKVTEATTTQLSIIGLFDIALLAIAWFVIFKVFGIEAASLAMIFWGCNYIARFAWTGCGFLRSDWLVTSLFAIAALRTKREFLGGFLLAYAGLLRIFPFAFMVGIFLKFVAMTIVDKDWSIWKTHRQLLSGFFAGLVSLATIATFNGGGLSVWDDFIYNTSKHYNTVSTNMMGLRAAMGVSPGSFSEDIKDPQMKDSFHDWSKVREIIFKQRKPVYVVIALTFLIALGAIVRVLPVTQAAILGLSIIVLIRLSNYDYYFLSFFALLIPQYVWPALIVMFTGLWSWHMPAMFGDDDKGYFSLTLLTILSVICVMASMARELFMKKKTLATSETQTEGEL